MWRSKKFLLLALLVPAVLVGSMGGVALAQTDSANDSQPEARHEALLDRVATIYQENTGVAIDPEALKEAFAQANSEMRAEALENRLQGLVDEGTITQEEAGQYLDWWQSKPDVPVGFGTRGPGGFRGMCRLSGWGGPGAPAE